MTEAKRVIVTGATGAIGSHLCQELIKRGYAVVAFSRDPAAARTKVPGAADYVAWQPEEIGPWAASTLFLWRTEEKDGSPVILAGHAQAAPCLAFSRDGRWLVSGGEDHTVRLWDIVSGECVRVLKGHSDTVTSAAFNYNGTRVASCSQDKSVRVWNIADQTITKRALTKPSGIIQRVQMFTGEGPTFQPLQEQVLLWTLPKSVTYYEVEQENTLPTSVAFHKNDTLLVSGYYSGPAKIWYLDDQKLSEL